MTGGFGSCYCYGDGWSSPSLSKASKPPKKSSSAAPVSSILSSSATTLSSTAFLM